MTISGLKLSSGMVALTVRPEARNSGLFPRLCRALADARINLTFIAVSEMGSLPCSLCCIDLHDQARTAEVLASDDRFKDAVGTITPVGIVTCYPHHFSLRLLGSALDALAGQAIGLHALSSSISSICFVIDFVRLQEAERALRRCFGLPDPV